MRKNTLILASLATLVLANAGGAQAADKKKELPASAPSAPATPAAPAAPSSDGERVNVESIKEKYWARGDESEIGVVQNRLYSKNGKFDIGLYGGVITTDPFLTVQTLGGSVGYHFTEYMSLHAIGWKAYVGKSGAYTSFQEVIVSGGGVAAIPATNNPRSYFGMEGVWSILYGKLSLLGASIIYYDMHLLGGAGVTGTENGSYATPSLGLGQKVYLSKTASLRLDYRLLYYRETLKHKVDPADASNFSKNGQVIGDRNNFTNSITLGVDFLFGGLK